MIFLQTDVFPEAVPPATPIRKGPREEEVLDRPLMVAVTLDWSPLALGEGDASPTSNDRPVPFCWDDRDGLEGGVKGQLSLSTPSSIPNSFYPQIVRTTKLIDFALADSASARLADSADLNFDGAR